MPRLTLNLTNDEGALLGRLAMRSDTFAGQSDTGRSLAAKIRNAILESEPEPDEVAYIDIGGEAGDGS